MQPCAAEHVSWFLLLDFNICLLPYWTLMLMVVDVVVHDCVSGCVYCECEVNCVTHTHTEVQSWCLMTWGERFRGRSGNARQRMRCLDLWDLFITPTYDTTVGCSLLLCLLCYDDSRQELGYLRLVNLGSVCFRVFSECWYLWYFCLSKKSRLGRRKCWDTTRAPNNVN